MKIFYVIIILFIVVCALFGLFLFSIKDDAEKGKRWCEDLIDECISDRDGFLKKHAEKTKDGYLYLKPTSENKGVKAFFQLKIDGGYECTYWVGGMTGPHGEKYDSKTQEWINID